MFVFVTSAKIDIRTCEPYFNFDIFVLNWTNFNSTFGEKFIIAETAEKNKSVEWKFLETTNNE